MSWPKWMIMIFAICVTWEASKYETGTIMDAMYDICCTIIMAAFAIIHAIEKKKIVEITFKNVTLKKDGEK